MPSSFNRAVAIKLANLLICVHCNQANAGNWIINPFLQFQEIYSDNLKLAQPGNEIGGFVTSTSPGINISRRAGRNSLNLNYQMQNVINGSGSEGISTFNQLQFNTRNTLVSNKLFLNANSSINQQNISNVNIATDNLTGGNRANVNTFSLSPYWTPHFGNYANGTVRINFAALTTDAISAANQVGSSDTINLGETIQLNSGSEFKRVGWNFSFNNRDNDRVTGSDVSFQTISGTLRTNINKKLNIFVQAGASDNNFQTLGTANANGFFYTLGAQLTPNHLYNIAAGVGNNSYVTFSLFPNKRLSWVTTLRDNQIGLNPGQTWQMALNYRTLRSFWSIRHINDTTTTQALLLEQSVITIDGNPDPLVNQPEQVVVSIPTLTDQVIVTKTWNCSVTFNTSKSNISLGAFDQNRDFQATGTNEKVTGINARWIWRFASKTSAYIVPVWQEIDRGQPQKDNRYDFSIGLNRAITSRLNGRLEFRHLEQTSVITTNNFEENRATASLVMRF